MATRHDVALRIHAITQPRTILRWFRNKTVECVQANQVWRDAIEARQARRAEESLVVASTPELQDANRSPGDQHEWGVGWTPDQLVLGWFRIDSKPLSPLCALGSLPADLAWLAALHDVELANPANPGPKCEPIVSPRSPALNYDWWWLKALQGVKHSREFIETDDEAFSAALMRIESALRDAGLFWIVDEQVPLINRFMRAMNEICEAHHQRMSAVMEMRFLHLPDAEQRYSPEQLNRKREEQSDRLTARRKYVDEAIEACEALMVPEIVDELSGLVDSPKQWCVELHEELIELGVTIHADWSIMGDGPLSLIEQDKAGSRIAQRLNRLRAIRDMLLKHAKVGQMAKDRGEPATQRAAAQSALDLWLSRLRQVGDDLRAAPVPDLRPPAIWDRMTVAERARADARQRETADRINRINLLWNAFADLLQEQPDVARAAGVSEATLADSRSGFRASSAVLEITGDDPLRHSVGQFDDSKRQRLTCTAINRLLAEGAKMQSSGESIGVELKGAMKRPSRKTTRPNDRDFAAWRLAKLIGMKQNQIAQRMTDEGMPISQGEVSRAIRKVDEFLAGGNSLPALPQAMPAKRQTLNPAMLDIGPTVDRKTKRQRKRRDDA